MNSHFQHQLFFDETKPDNFNNELLRSDMNENNDKTIA